MSQKRAVDRAPDRVPCAIGQRHLDRQGVDAAWPCHVGQPGSESCPLLFDHEFGERMADQRAARPSEDAAELRIGVDEPAPEVDLGDADAGRTVDRTEALLALPQRPLHLGTP